jgi:hypothetical protein
MGHGANHHVCDCGYVIPSSLVDLTEEEYVRKEEEGLRLGWVAQNNLEAENGSTLKHEWREDNTNFVLEQPDPDDSSNLKLFGVRVPHTHLSGVELVLGREILRQSGRIGILQRSLSDTLKNRDAVRGIKDELSHDLGREEAQNIKLTDCINYLECRIEEALELMIHETEGSRRVESAYRILERALLTRTIGDKK